jgi:hypothetical protein
MPVVEEIIHRTFRWELPADDSNAEDADQGVTFSASVDGDGDIEIDIDSGDIIFCLKPAHLDGFLAVLRSVRATL